MNARDTARERAFFVRATPDDATAARRAFTMRLDRGQQLYGDRWTTRTVRALGAEIVEEIEDTAAWAALCEQAIDRGDFTVRDRARLRRHLIKVVKLAARQHEAMQQFAGIADGMLPPPGPEAAMATALRLIEQHIPADGRPYPIAGLKAAAQGRCAWRTVQRAGRQLRVKPGREGFPSVGVWRRPPVATSAVCVCDRPQRGAHGDCAKCGRAIAA